MKLGLIARADDRGLGIMCWELARHMHTDRVLVVREPVAEGRGFPPHLDRYPGAQTVTYDAGLDETTVRDWLAGLDVVYSAETFYDPRLIGWARDAGVRTVLHVMPEFLAKVGHPEPDALWAPTNWRLEHLPEGTRVVPVPVATDRFDEIRAANRATQDGPLRVLHTVGHRAMADRNGTMVVTRAVSTITEAVQLTMTGQDGRLPSIPARRRGKITTVGRPGGVADYWDTYRDQDVLVLPRRFGGLCLPVQEAMAAGVVPVLPDVPPNQDWPAVLTPASTHGTIVTAAGVIPLAATRPADLAAAIDDLARDRERLAAQRELVDAWVQAHSWEALAPLYTAELARIL